MKLRFYAGSLVLGLLIILAGCSKMDSNVLAVIDGKNVMLDEFTSTNPASRFANKDNDYIDSKVDEFVQKSVFTAEALALGLDKSDDIMTKKERAARRQMLQYVYDRAIVDAAITDELLKDIYDKSGKEINARHILVQFSGLARSSATRSKMDALAIMGQIKNRLSNGEAFEDLATEFTEDPTGRDSGGDLGWFGWGKMVGPFQEEAFRLKAGEVSDIVETQFGFHIIKVEGIREIERGSFEEEKDNLKRQARREKSSELGQKATQFLAEQKSKAGFNVLTKNVHDFYMIADKSTHKQGTLDMVLQNLNFMAPLFELNGEQFGGEWIINELSQIEEGQKPSFRSENELLTILDQLVTQTIIINYGYEHGYDKEENFSSRIDGMVERYAYDAFIAQEVNAELEPSPEELMDFYEANKATKYMDPKKVLVREIFVKDSLFALDLKKRIDAGEMIDILAGRYTERKATKEKRGELPPFQEGRYGLMGKAAFEMEVGEIRGPIKLGNGYSIIKLEQVLPAGPKEYNKVKGRVRTEIMSELRTNRTQKVYDALAKKHNVKINYAAVHDFYAAESE